MMKILLVDDETSFIEQTKLYLEKEREDFEIEILTDSIKAVEKIKRNDYDAVVSDYQMPDLDGLKLLKIIKKEMGLEIPFIFFTGRGREEVAMEALNLGADMYLKKGGDPKSQYGVLAEALEQQIERYRIKEYLERSRAEYKNLIDSISDILLVHDFECNIVMVNNTAVQLLGYDKKELLDMCLYDLFESDGPDIIEDLIHDIDTNEKLVFEGKVFTNSDDIIPVEVSSSHIRYDEENRVLSVIRDISERNRAVKQLHKIIEDYEK